MADKNYIECGDCRKRWNDDRSPDMCGSKEAKGYFQKLNPDKHIIPYCEDFNKNRDCKFQKLNFSGLIGKIIEEL